MKRIGCFEFPTTEEEIMSWKPLTAEMQFGELKFVASTCINGTWCAYLGDEKILSDVAFSLFPIFKEVPYE